MEKILNWAPASSAKCRESSFFMKRRGPLVPNRHFSWSGGVRSSQIVIFHEAEGSARPKTSFFMKRRGPLVPKRRFSWSGGVRSSQNVIFHEAEGSACPKTPFFMKRRGPLAPKRHFSWSGGVRSSKNVVFCRGFTKKRDLVRYRGNLPLWMFLYLLTRGTAPKIIGSQFSFLVLPN